MSGETSSCIKIVILYHVHSTRSMSLLLRLLNRPVVVPFVLTTSFIAFTPTSCFIQRSPTLGARCNFQSSNYLWKVRREPDDVPSASMTEAASQLFPLSLILILTLHDGCDYSKIPHLCTENGYGSFTFHQKMSKSMIIYIY